MQRKESTANDRRVSFNNETEIHYRTASEDSSTSTLHSKIKITCKSSKETETGFKSAENNRSYTQSTSFFGSQGKKAELENKFDMLLNGNCSWSYKSLKVINNHKTDNESNRYSHSLIQNSQVTLQNKASHDRVESERKYRPGNDNIKRKFFDLDDSSSELKNFTAVNSYDFDEFDQAKTTKKPRKITRKKKIEKSCTTIETKPKKVRPSRTKKKVEYAEWDSNSELGSDKNDNQIKYQSDEQVSQICLNKNNEQIKLQSDSDVSSLKNEQLKLQSDDKVSPITTVSRTDNTDYESDCSDNGFVFLTRFSDKNTNVVDITNSIESDSVEATQTSNGICDNASLLISNVENNNRVSEEVTKLVPSDVDRISSTDHNPHAIYINKLSEPNGSLESENSPLSLPEQLDFEDRNIKTRITENELNNEQFVISVEDKIYGKCNKINEEVKEMYDKLEQEIFQPDDEFETISFKQNSELEEVDKNVKFKSCERDANKEKFKFAKEKDWAETNVSKLMFTDRKSKKINLFELKKENNTKYNKQSNNNKSFNVTNSSKTQYSNKGTNKIPFNTTQPNDYSNLDESLHKTQIQAPIFCIGTDDEYSSDDNYKLIEMNEVNNSIGSSNSSEIYIPALTEKNSVTKQSNNNLNTITGSLNKNYLSSEKHSKIQNISEKGLSNNNQWEISIKGFSNDKINLKLENNISSENNHRGKNTESTKRNQSPTSPKPTKILKFGKKLAVSPKALFSNVTSKENGNKKQNYGLFTAKKDNGSKPKTWEDLENKLLTENDNNTEHEIQAMYPEKDIFFSTPKIISNAEEDKRHSDFWEEKRELKVGNFFEISQYKRSKRVITSKKKQHLTKEQASNKPLYQVSNQASTLESPSMSIINKAIAAMNRSTSEYFSKNEGNSFGSWSENSNVDVQGTEYSYSILSTTIQTSGKKLNLTEKRSKYIQKVNDDAKGNKLELKKNKSFEEDNMLNENIFSMATKQVITSNCKAKNKENLTLESLVKDKQTSQKDDNAKISRKNRNTNDVPSVSSKHNGYAQDGSDDDNILILDNQDFTEGTSRMDNDDSDSKYYFEQRYSLRKRKSVIDSNKKNNKKQNVSVLKEEKTTYSANEKNASLKKAFSGKRCQKIKRNEDSTSSSQSDKCNKEQLKSNQAIKQFSPKDKYIKYLKNLFQNDTAQETKINSGENCNNEQNTSQHKPDGTKFLMKEDDLFSISSGDYENDETGYCSGASGLFYDVLDED